MAAFDGQAFATDLIKVALGSALERKGFGNGAYFPQLGGAPDQTPPSISNVSPVPDIEPGDPGGFPIGYGDARSTPIGIDISDAEPGLRMVMVSCRIVMPEGSTPIRGSATVYRAGQFQEGFGSSSSSPIPSGVHLSIVRDEGWPPGSEVFLDVDAVDAAGNVTPSEGEDVVLTLIAVTPHASTFNPANPADTRQMTATGTYSDGSTEDITALVTWSTHAPATATISNVEATRGRVTAVAEGTTTITATLGAVSGSTTLTIALTLTTIVVTPAASTFSPANGGVRQQMTATGTYSNGSTRDVTAEVAWASTVTAVATISNVDGQRGQVAAVTNGGTSISATLGAVSGGTSLTVAMAISSIDITPAAPTFTPTAGTDRLALTATATYTNGATANVTGSAVWASSVPTMATASGGQVAPLLVGAPVISATVGAASGNTTVTLEVRRDATSLKRLPQNAFQWGMLGLPAPSYQHECQEASGNLADSVGSLSLVVGGSPAPAYSQAVAGWSRLAVRLSQTNMRFHAATGTGPIPSLAAPGGSCAILVLARFWSQPATTGRVVCLLGNSLTTGMRMLYGSTSGLVSVDCCGVITNGAINHVGGGAGPGPVYPMLLQYDKTGARARVLTSLETITGTYNAGVTDGPKGLGTNGGAAAPVDILFDAMWTGAAAESLGASLITALGY